MLYSPRYRGNITFQGTAANLSYFFLVLLSSFSSHLKIILKQLFTEGEVNVRLDFRRSLESGLCSSPRGGMSAGSFSRTAAGNRA